MTDGRFVDAAPVVAWTAVGVFFYGVYLLTSIGLNITAQTRYYPLSTLAGAGLNLGLNLVLIPRFGLLGAAWANAAGYAVQTVLAYRFSQRFYPIAYDHRRIMGLLVITATAYLVAVLPPEMPALVGVVVRGGIVVGVTAGGLLVTGIITPADARMLTALRRGSRTESDTAVPPGDVTEKAGEIVSVDVARPVETPRGERQP
jgi:O-antigen/teichoic acid export membrane protein